MPLSAGLTCRTAAVRPGSLRPVEEVPTPAVFVALAGVDVAVYVRQRAAGLDDGRYESVRSDDQALKQLIREHCADYLIGRAEFFATRDTIQTRLNAIRARLPRRTGHQMLSRIAGAGD